MYITYIYTESKSPAHGKSVDAVMSERSSFGWQLVARRRCVYFISLRLSGWLNTTRKTPGGSVEIDLPDSGGSKYMRRKYHTPLRAYISATPCTARRVKPRPRAARRWRVYRTGRSGAGHYQFSFLITLGKKWWFINDSIINRYDCNIYRHVFTICIKRIVEWFYNFNKFNSLWN